MCLRNAVLLMALMVGVCLSSGCVAINSLGVKGFPIRSGLYAGMSRDYIQDQNVERDYVSALEVGYTDLRDADLAHRFTRVYGSISEHDGFRRRAGLETGYEFLSMGADWDLGDDFRRRFFIGSVLGTTPAHITVAFYDNENYINQELDIHYTFLPMEEGDDYPDEPVETDWFISVGQRLAWYEGAQGAALFAAVARVIEPRQEGEWRQYNVTNTWLVELSGMVDNSAWFRRDDFEVQARLAFALKYFF